MTAMTMNHEPITLLNASYEVLSANVTLQKAARLLSLGKATVEEAVPGRQLGGWAWPKVLKLTYYVKIAHDKLYGAPRVSKRGVLLRDNRTCAYCGEFASTIDHVHPRSRGGKNTWQNMVAACLSCNHKKGSRTPEEAHMTLKWEGYVPKRTALH
jgi:hypothetical protein